MIYIEQAFWRLALFIFGRVVPRPYGYFLCANSLGVFYFPITAFGRTDAPDNAC